MRVKLFRVFGFFLLIAVSGFGRSSVPEAYARDDWQYWHGYSLRANFSDKLTGRLSGDHRLKEDFRESFFGMVEPGILWHPFEFLDIGSFYRYQRSKSSHGDHTNENRYYLEGILKKKFGNLSLSDRTRVEYRERNAADMWRFRNQIQAGYKFPIKEYVSITPYAAEEILYDTEADKINDNRVTLGIAWRLHRHLGIKTYYRIKSKRSLGGRGSFDEEHILGTKVSIFIWPRFDRARGLFARLKKERDLSDVG